ncbi:MAG: Ig-like domain repeat protein, partial [Armatimonadetes bacterium]|nr:Ig-like domain repeat protein [Armatimonadota bacterium]
PRNDRQHWTYHNARDTGWPISGRLVVEVGQVDPMIHSPHIGFDAADCASVTIRMAARLNDPVSWWLTGQLFWERDNGAQPFSEAQSIQFPIINDGQFHDYVLPLASKATWAGFISRLRFDPVFEGRPGDYVEIAWVSCRPTTLNVSGVSGRVGQSVLLTADLHQGGGPASGRTIAFAVEGSSAGAATTDGFGTASLSYAIPEGAGAGTRAVTAAFTGDDLYAPSSGFATLTVGLGATSMYVVDREGIITTPTILRAFLYRQPGNVGIPVRGVAFSVAGTSVGSATTEASGRASLDWVIDAPAGSHTIRAEFAGDGAYEPCSGEATLQATVAVTKVYVPDRSAKIRRTAVLRAHLYELTNKPIAGKTVSLRLGGTEVGSGTTSATGRLQIMHVVPEGPGAGVRAIQGVFAGTAGYLASSGTGKLTVERGDVYMWPFVRSGKRGTSHPLRAYVRSLPDYVVLPGKTIAFAVDGTGLGSATVAETGWATLIWDIPLDTPTGGHTASMTFDGDAWFVPAVASSQFEVVP